MPSWGLSQKLPRLLGPQRARYLSLGCVRINAREALEWGLVSQVCTDRAALEPYNTEVGYDYLQFVRTVYGSSKKA